jgi:hypothetical protein
MEMENCCCYTDSHTPTAYIITVKKTAQQILYTLKRLPDSSFIFIRKYCFSKKAACISILATLTVSLILA